VCAPECTAIGSAEDGTHVRLAITPSKACSPSAADAEARANLPLQPEQAVEAGAQAVGWFDQWPFAPRFETKGERSRQDVPEGAHTGEHHVAKLDSGETGILANTRTEVEHDADPAEYELADQLWLESHAAVARHCGTSCIARRSGG
jgi:hypothetical protein